MATPRTRQNIPTVPVGPGPTYQYVVDKRSVNAAYQKFMKTYGDYGRLYTLPKGLPGAGRMGGISLGIHGIQKFADDLSGLADGVSRQIRERFADLAYDILLQAVRQAPVESGQLRESAKAWVGRRKIAEGTNSGTEGGANRLPFSSKTGWSNDPLTLSVSFDDDNRKKDVYRDRHGNIVARGVRGYPTQSDDFLVSTWTHENMEYHGAVEGTGPKYLERAFNDAYLRIITNIQESVSQGMVLSLKK